MSIDVEKNVIEKGLIEHGTFQVALVVKNWLANAEHIRDKRHRFGVWVGKIPWSEGMSTHSSILAQRIPWTEDLVGYSP